MEPKLSAARLRAAHARPYLATALWTLMPIPTPGLGTMGCDQSWRLYYDPAVLPVWTVPQLATVLVHEVSHLLREHAERTREQCLDPWRANLAGDEEINDDLVREGLEFPVTPVTPKTFGHPDGLLMEEYYTRLPDPSRRRGGGLSRPSTPGQDTGDEGPEGGAAREPTTDGPPSPGDGSCGSCADGEPKAYEDPRAAKVSPGEAELLRRQVAREIAQASQGQGEIPAGWRRWADLKLRPKIDWRKTLARLVRQTIADVAGQVDFSYRRPSRRQSASPQVVLPSMRRPLPSIAVVVDTSGSVNDTMLAQAVAEVGAILKGLGQREGVHVLAVDAAVHVCKNVFRERQIELEGGGGTAMDVGIEAAARLKPKPQVCIVLTDGMTPWGEPPKGMRVVVGLVGAGARQMSVPHWARKVVIDE